MALEFFQDGTRLGGFDVVIMDELRAKYPDKFNESGGMDYEWFEKEIRPKSFIYVRKDVGSISFTLQNGPVHEAGVNGCQVDALIEAAHAIITMFNMTHPCRENSIALTKLDEALMWLKRRTEEREKRGVEGTGAL